MDKRNLVVFLLIGLITTKGYAQLQCYVCENCEDSSVLDDSHLAVCESLTTVPTTVSTEPTTVSTEPTTVSTEPTTDPTEPNTDTTEPNTDPTEPNTDPTEPTTLPTEPTTLPTEPTTLPTEQTTLPTEPTTLPTEPTTLPTEPTTLPTEPTTLPTEPTDSPQTPPTEPTPAPPTDAPNPTSSSPTNPTSTEATELPPPPPGGFLSASRNSFGKSRLMKQSIQYNCYIIQKPASAEGEQPIVNRGCVRAATTQQDTCTIAGNGLALERCELCNTDGCNSASNLAMSFLTIFGALILVKFLM